MDNAEDRARLCNSLMTALNANQAIPKDLPFEQFKLNETLTNVAIAKSALILHQETTEVHADTSDLVRKMMIGEINEYFFEMVGDIRQGKAGFSSTVRLMMEALDHLGQALALFEDVQSEHLSFAKKLGELDDV